MANAEQLEILRQGVEVWNAWRETNPGVRLDLLQADLTGANLYRAVLTEANLYRAVLTEANLQQALLAGTILTEAELQQALLQGAILWRANLQGAILYRAILFIADLQWADLREADLQKANLYRAILTGADLTGADFTGADLTEVNLQGAILAGTYMGESIIKGTVFVDVDLQGVQDLDRVVHRGPSSIDIHTLYKSQGDIPEDFLRGCGVPDSMIDYAHSLVAAQRPIDYYSVFISYSSQDEAIAQRLHADLQARGVRCWFAPHDLEIGEVITRGIDEAIRIYDKLLIILSEAAVTSRWVEFEVSTALHREVEQGRTMLFPIRLDDTVLHASNGWAAQLRSRHIGDFRGWKDHDRYQAVFMRLLRDLKAKDQARTEKEPDNEPSR